MTDRCDLLCLDVPAAELIRAELPTERSITARAARARACADPTRLAMLLALDHGSELCVCDIGWIVAKPQNLVSHHLRKLRDAGLVVARREAKVVFYAITDVGSSCLAGLAGIEAEA